MEQTISYAPGLCK